jgi:hypothetical protein
LQINDTAARWQHRHEKDHQKDMGEGADREVEKREGGLIVGGQQNPPPREVWDFLGKRLFIRPPILHRLSRQIS